MSVAVRAAINTAAATTLVPPLTRSAAASWLAAAGLLLLLLLLLSPWLGRCSSHSWCSSWGTPALAAAAANSCSTRHKAGSIHHIELGLKQRSLVLE
jgi:hypothetical protein